MNQANIILGGDAMFGRSVSDSLENMTHPYKELYGNVYKTLKSVDGVFVNLETTITNHHRKYKKTFNYKLNPDYKDVIKTGNIKYVSLSNNHICDFNKKGMYDTIKYLNELNVKYSGAGDNADEHTTLNINGITFAFLSAADHYTYWSHKHKNNRNKRKTRKNNNNKIKLDCIWHINMSNRGNEQRTLIQDKIKRLKKKLNTENTNNHIIFSLHFNSNKVDKIEAKYIDFCRELIEAGASIIYCHSPHHVLPYEEYITSNNRKGYIFYSLGAFIDDYAIDNYRDDLSILPQLSIKNNTVKLEKIHKIKISDKKMNFLTDPIESKFIDINTQTNNLYNFIFTPFNKDTLKMRNINRNVSRKRNLSRKRNPSRNRNLSIKRNLSRNRRNNNSNKTSLKNHSNRYKSFKKNENLIDSLIGRCLLPREGKFKQVFLKVDRKNFIDSKEIGYLDRPSGIGYNQTITAPHLHAHAVNALKDKLIPGNSVLDVGCGSGYLVGIFSYLVEADKKNGKVVGIDIVPELIEKSKANLKKDNSDLLNNQNVKIVVGNGWKGYPEKSSNQYDAIHVGAMAKKFPIELWKQLKPGGRIYIPIGKPGNTFTYIYDKPLDYCEEVNDKCLKKKTLSVRYVPLVDN